MLSARAGSRGAPSPAAFPPARACTRDGHSTRANALPHRDRLRSTGQPAPDCTSSGRSRGRTRRRDRSRCRRQPRNAVYLSRHTTLSARAIAAMNTAVGARTIRNAFAYGPSSGRRCVCHASTPTVAMAVAAIAANASATTAMSFPRSNVQVLTGVAETSAATRARGRDASTRPCRTRPSP
jgi:hypothetical protein